MNGGFWQSFGGLADPFERRWLIGRLNNRWAAPKPVRPAYLEALPILEEPAHRPIRELTTGGTDARLAIPGGPVWEVTGANADQLVQSHFPETAQAAAFHSFCWLAEEQEAHRAAFAKLWPAWLRHHLPSRPTERGPAPWAVDTTALRAVFILDAARRIGLPGPARQNREALAEHAKCLQESLCRFTPPAFQRVLAGHALVRIGCDLAMPNTGRFGINVLISEAAALLRPSGMSDRQSTSQHLALCYWLVDAWLAARREKIDAGPLEELAARALGVLPQLFLPGGMPLIGEANWARPAGWLDGLGDPGRLQAGWTGSLPADEREAVRRLAAQSRQRDLTALAADGWLRVDVGAWSGLWHCPPAGWCAPARGGHQDLGAPTLHFGGVPLFVDGGGVRFGLANGEGLAGRAAAHGGLQADGHEPLPEDRPDYTEEFRREAGGKPPAMTPEFDGASLAFFGLRGLAGLRDGHRRWLFEKDGFLLSDMLNGTGSYVLVRRLITPFAATQEDPRQIRLEDGDLAFRLTADQDIRLKPAVQWSGYGQSRPLTAIEVNGDVTLPWSGKLRVEKL